MPNNIVFDNLHTLQFVLLIRKSVQDICANKFSERNRVLFLR